MGVVTGGSRRSLGAKRVRRILLQRNIEDLQFAYGTDPTNANLPDQYVYSNGFPDAAGLPVRAVRVTVVATHDRLMRKAANSLILTSQPFSIETPLVPPPTNPLLPTLH